MKQWTGKTFSTGAKQLAIKNAFAILRSYYRCRRELRREKPDVLLAMGSYSSLPPVLAARAMNIPIVLHEANTVPGRAVDFLAKYATKVAISFEETSSRLPGATTVKTGLPIRANIANGKRFDFIPKNAFVVFVTGGSQGAHAVNLLASDALVQLHCEIEKREDEMKRPLYIIHQTGVKDEGLAIATYAKAKIPSRVHAFEREMADAFASADFVIARAGASTCFELAACEKPALMIPLPSALRDHQHFNAEAFAKVGAADEGIQANLASHQLFRYLLAKYDNPDQLSRMRERMKCMATNDAADRVADLVASVAKKNNLKGVRK